MKTMLKRLWLSFLIACEEIHLNDLRKARQNVQDARTLISIIAAVFETEKNLAKLRSDYNATLPVGQRKTWRTA